ncbi:MAG TPA: indolepyruvate ferredoxin oxidoreductase family protein [Acidimicrobiales bacterium]|nr:indolepyruvate ferredoxin oxidoreductase family protein [Acidimicrobiales bacterium]
MSATMARRKPVAAGPRDAADAPGPDRDHVSLDDVYGTTGGRALMSGVQAIVRLVLEQRRLDRSRGLDTAAFVSGYEGSPLGGLDLELRRAQSHLDEDGVVFTPGLNEELAATAVSGTQLLTEIPGHDHDGVAAFWYGKNPGLDRAADAIRHGNYAGTEPLGGAVALIGDDPTAKSSTLPSSSVSMAANLYVPLLSPGSVADVVRLGLHAVALSRYSGLWAGLQIVADVADGAAVVDLGAAWPEIPVPDTTRVARHPLLVGPSALDAEEELFAVRLPRALEYAELASLNAITVDSPRARLGIMASGHAYSTVLRALEDMGLDDRACAEIGLRLIRICLPWPLGSAELRRLTRGLEEVLVVEDKAPFLESQLKEALYGCAEMPRVVGKVDPEGRPLVPATGSIDADTVTRVLAARLGPDRLPAAAAARLEALTRRPRLVLHVDAPPARTPAFCSGCPHNISTRAGDDQLVGLGIGCHIMAGFDAPGRGHQVGMTQMGGEGAQWTGLAPFAGGQHYVQNIGDGTFFHSGSLAVRAAVAAGVNITYKLLYNDAVAMTGGQKPEGGLAVPELTRLLAVEGVRRVIVTTPDPKRYRGVELDPIATVRHRDDLVDATRELGEVGGVTVLIHDDRCAAEERRLRRRGQLAEPTSRVWINPSVCEGCGDCGEKSSCLSVVPIETEFGRKTAVHQGSCNDDRSCLNGDCPSFVLVTPDRSRQSDRSRWSRRRRRRHDAAPRQVAEPPVDLGVRPRRRTPDDLLVRLPGIGGTGVVTVSRILQMAAHLDGLYASGLDQTGLAQKGGPVTSDVRIARRPIDAAVKATARSVDLLLGLDVLGTSSDENLATADAGRTVAVVNQAGVATAAMVRDPSIPYFSDTARIDRSTRAAENLYLDAQWISERLFGEHLPTNLVMLGAAYQHGCLPVSDGAIEEAIRLNGAGAAENLAAFRWGRAAVIDHDAVMAALAPAPPPVPALPVSLRRPLASAPAVLADLLEVRAADLVGYQSTAYARRYLQRVLEVAGIESERTGDPDVPVAAAYARGLHKLMAYKDEYEVARLHLDAATRTALRAEFGEGAATRVLLHPPVLKALGLKRKIGLGHAAGPAFRMLRAGRHLRGTALDPFGWAEMRRTERALVDEYDGLVSEALGQLHPASAGTVTAMAALADDIRGYEDVKRRNIDRFRGRAAELVAELGAVEVADDSYRHHHHMAG